MPSTPADRLLAAGTLVSALVLVALVVANWESFQPAASFAGDPVPRERTGEPAAATEADRAAVARPDDRRVRLAVATGRPATAEPPRTLEIGAAGGPTWLEVRAGGPDGEPVYYGLLADGDTATFERLPVWVRVGAADRVELTLAGKPARPPAAAPNGVVEFGVSAEGIAPSTS